MISDQFSSNELVSVSTIYNCSDISLLVIFVRNTHYTHMQRVEQITCVGFIITKIACSTGASKHPLSVFSSSIFLKFPTFAMCTNWKNGQVCYNTQENTAAFLKLFTSKKYPREYFQLPWHPRYFHHHFNSFMSIFQIFLLKCGL